MPQTIVPEEQKRANDLNDLRNNIWPTENRVVFLEGQSSPNDGLENLYWWDSSGNADSSNPPDSVASGISRFGDGGSDEGLWRRTFTPVSQLTTDDITEGNDNLYYTDNRARNALSAGGDLDYDPSTGEFTVVTYKSSDFNTDFSNKSTDDLTEGTSNRYFSDERAQDAVESALIGGNDIKISYDDSANEITITGTGGVNIEDNGTEVLSKANSVNFGKAIAATDQGNGKAKIKFEGNFGEAKFSGDGSTAQFQIPHGFSTTPSYFIVNATSDDGSGISHVIANDTSITVKYDTAPPSGTENISLNWFAL